MWAAVAAARKKMDKGALAARPPGVFSLAEFARREGMVVTSAHNIVKKMVEAGELEALVAYDVDARGRNAKINFYRPKA